MNVKILSILTLFSIFNPFIYANSKLNNNFLEKENYRNIASKKYKELGNNKIVINIKNIKEFLIDNNNDIKIYKDQISQAKALLKSNYSFWYPRVKLNSNELPKYSRGKSLNKLSSDTSTNQTSFGIDKTIEWDIVNPSRKLDILISKGKLENAKLFYQENLNRLLFEAIKRFFSIVALKQEIIVDEEAIEVAKFYLEESTNKFKSGLANKLEVLEANIQLERNRVSLIKKKGELTFQKNSLAEILNIKDEFSISFDKNNLITGIWIKDYEQSLSDALNNRNDLKISKNNIKITSNEALSTLSQKKPSFTLYNTYSYSKSFGERASVSPDINNLIEDSSNNVGIKFSLNLFDGGLIKENYNSIKLRAEELKTEFQKKQIEIKNEVEDTLTKLNISKEQIMYTYSQLISAKEAFDISLKRLEAGITTQREIINSQRDLLESESNYINSYSEYNVNLANLEQITGVKSTDLCQIKELEKNNSNYDFVNFLSNTIKFNC